MDRLAQQTPTTLRFELRDADGVLVDADAPPTCTITDAGGTTIVNARATVRTAEGLYDVAVTAAETALLGVYDVAWDYEIDTEPGTATSQVEVVGGFLCTLTEIRSAYEELADTAAYPAAKLRSARTDAETLIERECGVAFVPRGARQVLDGTGRTDLMVARYPLLEVVAVTVDGDPLTAEEVEALTVQTWGQIIRPDAVWPAGEANIVVTYTHGHVVTPPPVTRAAVRLTASYLLPSAVPDRALTESTDVGTIRYSVAGRDGPTGIPEVDAVLAQFDTRDPIAG